MIKWLGTENNTRHQLGAKAYHLSTLKKHYPVPEGFILSPKNYQLWLEKGQPETIPDALIPAIKAAYVTLATSHKTNFCLAVRSSATDEDGPNASFAGQYESYLNIIEFEHLLQAIVGCWKNAQHDRITAYRQQSKQTPSVGQLAILVQLLIKSDISFVAFSQNPLTSDRKQILINAIWGLGESLVQGSTTPDSYVVDKKEHDIIKQNIGRKEKMTIINDYGVKEVNIPRPIRDSPVLNTSQIKKISQLSCQLEKQLNWPVDIEGALLEEQLYLLQCRPITTLTGE